MTDESYEASKKFRITNSNCSRLVFQQVYIGIESDFAIPDIFDALFLIQCPGRKDNTTYSVRRLAIVVPSSGFIGRLSDDQTIR